MVFITLSYIIIIASGLMVRRQRGLHEVIGSIPGTVDLFKHGKKYLCPGFGNCPVSGDNRLRWLYLYLLTKDYDH